MNTRTRQILAMLDVLCRRKARLERFLKDPVRRAGIPTHELVVQLYRLMGLKSLEYVARLELEKGQEA